ncbi:MAG: hypothetical protein ACRDRU_22895 [Pseudonocardiaceae bacterium]
MSPRQARPLYDRWRDAGGVHVPDGCRVEVLGRTRSTRLLVRFDGEQDQVSIRPHLVRVIQGDCGG